MSKIGKLNKSMIYKKTGSINLSDRMDTFRNKEGFLIHKCWDIENSRNCICKNVKVIPLENEEYYIGELIQHQELYKKREIGG